MKIFCVVKGGRLGRAGSEEWYLLSDSMLLKSDNPMFVPDFDTDFRIFPAAAFLIERLGKSISRRFARRYYRRGALAAQVAACNLLDELRTQGEFVTPALAFDRSLLLGDFMDLDAPEAHDAILRCGDAEMQFDLTEAMDAADEAIERISRNNTLKTGDIIIPCIAGDGINIRPGMNLEVLAGANRMLEIRFK